jgi:hypothetical protein
MLVGPIRHRVLLHANVWTGVLSLIRPLYVVATEPRNEQEVRDFAIKHLRRLGLETGVRQPVVLADRIQQYMDENEAPGEVLAMDCDTFMLSGPY